MADGGRAAPIIRVRHRARRAGEHRDIAGKEELTPLQGLSMRIHPHRSAAVQGKHVISCRREFYLTGGLRVRSQNDIVEPQRVACERDPAWHYTRKLIRTNRFRHDVSPRDRFAISAPEPSASLRSPIR